MEQRFYDMVEANPVIAAIKDMDGLEQCCRVPDIKVVFILYGDICNIADIVRKIKEAGKIAIVHVDLIAGLSCKEVAELGLYTVMRFFVLDSLSFENIEKQLVSVKPDFIEVLPGVMPKIIRRVCKRVRTHLIAGGLISDKEDVMAALDAGAIAVSSTNQKVWLM